MIRFAALNYSSSEEDSQDAQERAATKEAEESEAFMLYNRALSLQRQGNNEQTEEAFRELLEHPFITEALEQVRDDIEGSTHPALQLLYSIHKNIANMALHRKDYKAAILSYIEAVKIDTTEVTVWYKIGTIAKQIYNFPLARMGFEMGLQCNPNHWPCLDNVITLLYAMNDYWYCLFYISKALVKDHGYTKGLVLRGQIFKEDPSLRETTINMFKDCDPAIDNIEIDAEDKEEFINECLKLAEERRQLSKPKMLQMVKLPVPIQLYTWCSLGEALLALYKMLKSSDPPVSMGCRVDFSAYNGEEKVKEAEQPMETDAAMTTDDMIVDDVDEAADQFDSKTVTSLEQFLSNLPADQMTELLQSTPPTPGSVTTTVQDHNTSVASPMETSAITQAESVPKVITDDIPREGTVSDNKDTESAEMLAKDDISEETKADPSIDTLSKELFPADSLSKSKTPKRKKGFLEDFGGKRRSARVRNTSKRKEEDCVNFQGLLLTFLPSTLRDFDEEVSSGLLQPMEETPAAKPADPVALCSAKSLCDTEKEEIRQLLLTMQKNSGCLDLMMQFIFRLAEKSNLKWPVGLTGVFLRVYKMVRNHFDLPDTFCDDEIDDNLIELGKTLLLYSELQLDNWTLTKSRFMSSPRHPQSPGVATVKESDLPPYYYDDEYFISGMISRPDVFGNFWSEYCVRVYWLKAKFYMLQNNMEDAVFFFKKALCCLKESSEAETDTDIQIVIPNCSIHKVLSVVEVEKQLKSLERSQSFDETQKWYDAGEFDKVVDCLLKTSLNKQVSMTTSATERRSQLLLLQDSLIKLKDYKRAFLWSEITLDEAVQAYKMSESSEKEQWAATLVQTCESLILIIKKDKLVISSLPKVNQARLSHNLIYMIDVEMSVPDTCIDMPIGTVLPWILLYKLIKKEESEAPKPISPVPEELDSSIPSSLMLLNIAHEYLGRHAWCTKSEGEFLLFYIGILTSEKSSSDIFNEELGQAVEQCFFCLYGHPTKKGRYRHLMDHNAPQIDLTWERTDDLFNYFKPKSVPEFDSYKTEAVPAEVEHLLRRICNLVPESQKPVYVIDSLQDYIDGTTDTFNEESIYNPSPVSQELYYLLADYYFKNHEQAKAIKYYMNDICVNPSRLDSWAGMALARMSQLEQKLNSTELKMDFPVHKKSIAALRCFRRALQIDESNGKLWMEYGSLAYQLHSHSSRQLTWKFTFPLSAEMEQIATNSRQEMLRTSYNCYRKAIECENEEEWLQHYMIGKCLEKMKKSPGDFLKHYEQATECLYEENAPYPKKIAYAYSTPHLAVEALEMFYRLHSSILKLILDKHQPDMDYQLFERFINKAASSPFASAKQKNEELLDSKETTGIESKVTDTPKSTPTLSQDHTYSKQKQKMSLLEARSGVVSLENSCSDSVSQESTYISSDPVSQSNDVSYDASADSTFQPMELDLTNQNSKGESSQTSFSNSTFVGSISNFDLNKSKTKTLELSENDMREEITNVQKVDISLSTDTDSSNKLNQIELLKKYDKASDSSLSIDSSDIYEDDEGNIIVTAKLENIGRSSSEDGEMSQSKSKVADVGTPMVLARQSFGFEPMITDETEVTKKTDGIKMDVDVQSKMEENSQDIKDSVATALENVVSTVETVDSILSDVTVKSEISTIKSEELSAGKDIVQHSDSIESIPAKDEDHSQTSEEEQKTDMNKAVASKKDSVELATSLVSQYESTSSEDEGQTSEKSREKSTVQILSANVSLCADYDSLSSENEDIENEEQEQVKKQGEVRTLGTSFDDVSHDNNVNVLEISEGGISGDVTEQDNKVKPQDGEAKKVDTDQKTPTCQSEGNESKSTANIKDTDDVQIEIDKMLDNLGPSQETNQESLGKTVEKKTSDNEKVTQGQSLGSVESQKEVANNEVGMEVDTTSVKEEPVSLQNTETEKSKNEENKMETNIEVVVEDSLMKGASEKQKETSDNKDKEENTEKMECGDTTFDKNEVNKDTAAEGKSGSEILKETDVKDREKNIEKKDDITEKETEVKLSGKTGEQLHKLLIEKCMAALHLCLSRFPTHYKSMYRLADVYVNSPYHKNLKFAQDLLLGSSNWQQQSHMPAQGLFGDKKQNNFFQGIWRIPIGDIDRSGSFASHMNRSVMLLLEVLKQRRELTLMYQIHLWMNRSPESGKKYLRDSERILFVKMSFRLCWEIIEERNVELTKMVDQEKLEKILLEVYKIWNYGNSSKMKNDIGLDTNKIFGETYNAAMKDKIAADRPLFKQAVDFCQHYNQVKIQMQKANQEGQSVGNRSESLFSPSRLSFSPYSPVKSTAMQSPSTQSPSVTASPLQQSKQLSSIMPNQILVVDKDKKCLSASVGTSGSNKSSQPQLANLTKPSETLRITQSQAFVKKLPEKTFVPTVHQKDNKSIHASSIQHKDAKPMARKPATNPFENPVVETLVKDINHASIFETLLANEFGNESEGQKKVKNPDEVDGSAKKGHISTVTDKYTKKQTIVVSKSSNQPIICKVDDSKGGLNIVSPEFGSLEVLSPNTPCPDTLKFSIPSKDPKTKTTIVITKRKPPLKITEPIEISSSDDEEDFKKSETTYSVAKTKGVTVPIESKQQTLSSSSAVIPKTISSSSSIPKISQMQKVANPPQQVQRSVIKLDNLDSAEDSIPSSSGSGSIYVPDDSSSDSIPSSPEPTNCRLDEITGLFIPPDVKFFNDNKLKDDNK
ncbi:calcineurin-binding protein cabin-1-like [Mytilus trossulus]|uniref:calcineurin-binding protein cabin-1-like n=1 Tax=Mytilus trossulus TaxID=6551 RepID=UPI003004A56E